MGCECVIDANGKKWYCHLHVEEQAPEGYLFLERERVKNPRTMHFVDGPRSVLKRDHTETVYCRAHGCSPVTA